MNISMLLGIIRHILTTAGGYLVSKGIISDAGVVESIVGGLLAGIGVIWSVVAKKKDPA